MLGSRKMIGATSIPDTAPTVDAKPQPSANIQPTRTPRRRELSGYREAARIARPALVREKNR